MATQIKSLYKDLVEYYFSPAVSELVKTVNGRPEEEKLLIQRLFKKEYTPTLSWESISTDRSVVAADVVSMNASLPLKNRGVVSTAKGNIPKLGLKFGLEESDMKKIAIMQALGRPRADIAKEVLNDAPNCVLGIMQRLEIQAQQMLSTGVVGLYPEQEGGTLVRLTYGAIDRNTINATAKWSEQSRTPVTDVKKMFDKAQADGKPIRHVLMSKATLDALASSEEGKQLFAKNSGTVVVTGATLATPNRKQMIGALEVEFEATFEVVNSNLFYEDLSGKKVRSANAWGNGAVVGLPSASNIGRIWWTELAEKEMPVEGVTYTTADDYILISKYSSTDPIQEFTKGEAMAIPILDNVHGIYRLKTL